METVWRDISQGVRSLRRAPGFVLIAVSTLALGIGANSAIYSLANGLLFRPLAVPNIHQLVAIGRERPGHLSIGQFFLTANERDLIAISGGPFETLIMSDPLLGALTLADVSEMVAGEAVSGNFFQVLGIRPVVGRLLPADSDAGTAVVISERLWRRAFGGDPKVLGATATMAGQPLTIVGVTPDSFDGTWLPTVSPTDVWVPITAAGRLRTVQGVRESTSDSHRTFARLRPGATRADADRALRAMGTRLSPSGDSFRAHPAEAAILFDDFARPGRWIAVAVVTLSTLVFLIACANLTNLFLVRGIDRSQAIAIRMATGASRGDVARLIVTEVALLTAVAALAAALVAWIGTRLMILVPLPAMGGLSVHVDPSPDIRVLLFGTGLAFVALLVSGATPTWAATRIDPMAILALSPNARNTAPRWGSRLRSALVGVQIMCSVVLVLLASMCVRSVQIALTSRTSMPTVGAAMARVNLQLHGVDETIGRRTLGRLLEAASAVPGIRSAAVATALPGERGARIRRIAVDNTLGREASATATGRNIAATSRTVAHTVSVTPGFFETVDLSIREGRGFTDLDAMGAPSVAIVTEDMAERLWPGREAVGRRIAIDFAAARQESLEVIGVVTVPGQSAESQVGTVYVPLAQYFEPAAIVIVRSTGSGAPLVEPFRRSLRAAEPAVALFDVGTLESATDPDLLILRTASVVVALLAALGFGIALLGVFGVMAYAVRQRARELAIRRALGATTARIYVDVLMRGLGMLVGGVVPGMVLAVAAMTILRNVNSRFEPYDPITLIAVPLAFVAIGIAACWCAGRRGANSDPRVILRYL